VFLVQEETEKTFQEGFKYLKEKLDMNPDRFVIDPHPGLTHALIKTFPGKRYETCPYYI